MHIQLSAQVCSSKFGAVLSELSVVETLKQSNESLELLTTNAIFIHNYLLIVLLLGYYLLILYVFSI